jgi:hypothetical protein
LRSHSEKGLRGLPDFVRFTGTRLLDFFIGCFRLPVLLFRCNSHRPNRCKKNATRVAYRVAHGSSRPVPPYAVAASIASVSGTVGNDTGLCGLHCVSVAEQYIVNRCARARQRKIFSCFSACHRIAPSNAIGANES